MWSKYQLAIAFGMVVTGSINTLATKLADKQTTPGPNGEKIPFQHPFLQAVCMFIGEFSCLIVFKLWFFWHKWRKTADINFGNLDFNPFLFFIPAMCDMTGTSLMYIGLNYTYASSFQMLRGAIIVFTALLSVGFLRSVIVTKQWTGIFLVIIGLALVGASDFVFGSTDGQYGINKILTGDMIILIAQIVSGCQMVVEEKFVKGKNVHPLQAVGWEGFFGMTTLGLLLIPMYYIPAGEFSGNPRGVLEDALQGLQQMGQNTVLLFAQLGSLFSIAFFNFFGISVTSQLNATTRMVLDSIRTIVIWGFSLIVKWEKFYYLQVIGFAALILGTAVYNNLIPIPCLDRRAVPLEVNDTDVERENTATEKTPLLYDTQGEADA